MIRFLFSIALLCAVSAVQAGPGAHGPNGEHLDTPAAAQSGNVHGVPRFEASTETFELVGQLSDEELSVVIDRFETNEPVANAKVELEFNGVTVPGQFHADHGDYAFTDARLLQKLAKPGSHGLVFTIVAGDESDLVDSTLVVAADEGEHTHEESNARWWMLGAALLLLAVAAIWLSRRLRRNKK